MGLSVFIAIGALILAIFYVLSRILRDGSWTSCERLALGYHCRLDHGERCWHNDKWVYPKGSSHEGAA